MVTVHVAEHTITVDYDDGAQRTFRRTTTQPVRSWKAQHPRTPTAHDQPTTGTGDTPWSPPLRAAQLTGRPLQPQGCYASLTRPASGRPLTLEPLSTLRQDQRAGHGLPLTTRRPSSSEPKNRDQQPTRVEPAAPYVS